jgi:hypothetical protein
MRRERGSSDFVHVNQNPLRKRWRWRYGTLGRSGSHGAIRKDPAYQKRLAPKNTAACRRHIPLMLLGMARHQCHHFRGNIVSEAQTTTLPNFLEKY